METKKCIKCGIVKPLDEYYKHPQMKSGYKNRCKACDKAYIIEYNKRTDYKQSEKYRLYLLDKTAKSKSDKIFKDLFPEKFKAKQSSASLPKIKGKEKHHWSYNLEHWKDVIYLTRSEHSIAHYYMWYDQERMKFRRLDGTLLDTKEEHLAYIKTLLK